MRLEQLYRIRFAYPEEWRVELEGGWEQHLYLAEGRCTGAVNGRFRGANFPYRRTDTGPFMTARLTASLTLAVLSPRALPGRTHYSHSMVPGGLEVTSRTTRLTSRTSLVMRVEIFARTSYGSRVQSAVIASSLDTGRSTTGWP